MRHELPQYLFKMIYGLLSTEGREILIQECLLLRSLYSHWHDSCLVCISFHSLLGHGGGGQNTFLDACDCNVQKKDSQHLEA